MLKAYLLSKNEPFWVYGAIGLYFLLGLYIAFCYDGTGDGGDSIFHYQYAHFAFEQPENFFSHWAKPLFTLFAAPFAQFGFVGVKIFNLLNAVFSLLLTYLIAKGLKFPLAWFSPLLLATATLYFTLIFSGLTEHFSSLLLLAAILLFIRQQFFWAAVILSFLPFVRSEGMLFIGVFGLAMLYDKLWKYIPVLGFGHIVYGLAGAAWHNGDFLWVFKKIPYARLDAYGKGDWGHFIAQLYYAAGLPLYIFGGLGIFAVLIFVFLKKSPADCSTRIKPALLLILGCFLVLISAHTAFWALGIFNSFGLPRVLNTVMPQFALLAGFSFGLIYGLLQNVKLANLIASLFFVFIIIMPFTRNPAAVNFPSDFARSPEQLLLGEVNPLIQAYLPDAIIYYSHPSICFYLNINPFDTNKARFLADIHQNETLPAHAILVWDSWFSVIEHKLTLEGLKNDSRFIHLQTFATQPYFSYALFKPNHN